MSESAEASRPLGAALQGAGGRIGELVRRLRLPWRDGSMHMPAVFFITVYAFLLLCIPSQLIIRPIGSPGTPANLWGIFCLLWWVVATLGGQNRVHGWTPTRTTFGLLALAVLTSYAAGTATGWYAPANIHQRTDELWTLVAVQPAAMNEKIVSAADRGLLSFMGWAGVVLLTCEGLRGWRDLELIVTWLSRFGGFVAALGIIQYFTGLDIAALFTIPGLSANSEFGEVTTRSVVNRVSSTAVHPIEFGVVMAGLFFLALHRSLFTPTSKLSWVPTLLIGIALPMSVSRSAIVAIAIIGIVIFAGWPSRWRFAALLVLPFAVVGMKLLAPGLLGTIRSLFTNVSVDPSVTGRTEDYDAVLTVYANHPLFGQGLYTFVPRYYRILDNQMLMSLIELGALGLTALIVFIITGYLLARGARRRSADPREQDLALAISGAIVGIVVSYFTFDAWGFPMVAGLTFLLIGMAGAASHVSRCAPQALAASLPVSRRQLLGAAS
jgi:polysaccharide biosynthesis protein PslJ